MKKKILIVDDDRIAVESLSFYFRDEGYEVKTAGDGEEGLKKLGGYRPDLIISDIVMPKLDGIGMLEKIKENPATKGIPVLVLSNLETKDSVRAIGQLGNIPYLIKTDHTLEELGKKVADMLEGL